MGNPKQKWTADEEEALRAGVAKHGPGKWKLIQKDPDFNRYLHSRSNIDLKVFSLPFFFFTLRLLHLYFYFSLYHYCANTTILVLL